MQINNLVVVGLGQIGSSIALAAKPAWQCHITGIDSSMKARNGNLEAGIIDIAAASIAELEQPFDLAVICTPVSFIASTAAALAYKNPDAVITDTGSVKWSVIEPLLKSGHASRFVPSHPLAGREKAGFQNADANMFSGRRVIITPTHSHTLEDRETVHQFWVSLNASTFEMDAELHDKIYAVVSHLVQLLAFTYACLLAQSGLKPPQDDGFKRFFRLYASGSAMWIDVFTANRANLSEATARFIEYFGSEEQNTLILKELPVQIAFALKQTMDFFSGELGTSLEKYVAGAYPDFVSPAMPLSRIWQPEGVDARVGRQEFIRHLNGFLKSINNLDSHALRVTIESMQKSLHNGIS